MKKESIIILSLPLSILFISILYYVNLILNLPVACTIIETLTAFIFFQYYFLVKIKQESIRQNLWLKTISYLMIATILYLIIDDTMKNSVRFGAWDAWWFWNYRAKFFTQNDLWNQHNMPTYGRNLVANRLGHADYSPGLSTAVAFFWKLTSSTNMLYPFLIALVFSISIPLLIFTELYQKNIIVASFVSLGLLVTNKFYIGFTAAMLADVWISFFLLASLVCWNNYLETKDKKLLFLTGLMLGGLIWSKNEGLFLAFAFIAFNVKSFLQKKNLLNLLCGLGLPLVLLIVFKGFFAPKGDLFFQGKSGLKDKITSVERYKLIWDYFALEINTHHLLAKLTTLYFGIHLVVLKKWPFRNFYFLLFSLLGYLGIYLISPHNLDWHISTSIDRIVWHLLPAFIYQIVYQLSENSKEPQILASDIPQF